MKVAIRTRFLWFLCFNIFRVFHFYAFYDFLFTFRFFLNQVASHECEFFEFLFLTMPVVLYTVNRSRRVRGLPALDVGTISPRREERENRRHNSMDVCRKYPYVDVSVFGVNFSFGVRFRLVKPQDVRFD